MILAVYFYTIQQVNLFSLTLLFSVRKRRGANKQTDNGAAAGARDPSRPVKTGSPQFVRELRSRTFPGSVSCKIKIQFRDIFPFYLSMFFADSSNCFCSYGGWRAYAIL